MLLVDRSPCVVESVAEPPSNPRWYAVYTCSRREKRVAEVLAKRQVEFFLPTYKTVRRWKDRRVTLDLPLFPGYVFTRIKAGDRLRVLEVPGVVRFVCFDGRPQPLPDCDVEALRNGLCMKLKAQPYPYLKVGHRVRIKYGPLQGVEGILVRKKDSLRLVISLDLIMRSVAVEVDAADIEAL